MAGSRRDIREAEKLAPLVPSHRVDDAPTDSDRLAVTHLLGREPQGAYRVVVRNSRTGWPVVIRNEPLLADGTPMPTRYWLVDPMLRARIGSIGPCFSSCPTVVPSTNSMTRKYVGPSTTPKSSSRTV